MDNLILTDIEIGFFRGPYSSYDPEVHGNGIYFATDKKIIKMSGEDFIGPLADSSAVNSITLNEDNTKFIISYLDGTIDELDKASSNYKSAIQNKDLEMPAAVGGLPKGTKVRDLEGRALSAILDEILFPTVIPTITNPTARLSLINYDSIQEAGAKGPTSSNLKCNFNRGAINLNGEMVDYRAGEAVEILYYCNGDESNTDISANIKLGSNLYSCKVTHEVGPQPQDNKGNNYGTSYPAGVLNTNNITISGTYAWYASTSGASEDNLFIKQPLVAWNTTAGGMSTGNFILPPSGTLTQAFKLPRKLATLKMYNPVTKDMEDVANFAEVYEETSEVMNVNGVDVTYYIYKYVGSKRSEVTLIATF